MKYSLKCYFDPSKGRDWEKLVYLGSSSLADKYTYDHYLSLLNNHVPFTVQFEVYDIASKQFYYHQIIADNSTAYAPTDVSNGEASILLITADPNNLHLLSQDEYKDEQKISELLANIARHDMSRFFKK